MSARMVKCAKLGKDLPGLEKPPFPGDAGQRIYEGVSEEAWRLWRDHVQIRVLNEYHLNMGDAADYEFMIDQMLTFLNLKETQAGAEESDTGKVE